MATQVSCPHCGRAGSTTKDIHPGKSLKCPGCGASFKIPTPPSWVAIDAPSEIIDVAREPSGIDSRGTGIDTGIGLAMTGGTSLDRPRRIPAKSRNPDGSGIVRKLLIASAAVASLSAAFILGVLSQRVGRPVSVGEMASDAHPGSKDRRENLKRYLGAKQWRDRLPLVRQTESIEKHMADYYGNFTHPSEFSIDEHDVKLPSNVFPEMECYYLSANVRAQGAAESVKYYFYYVKTRSGWKMDWDASTSFNPVSLLEFATNPKEGIFEFRVNSRLSQYFNFQYGDSEETHYSIDMTDEVGTTAHGYARKDSAFGKVVFDIFKSGNQYPVIWKVRHTRSSDVPRYEGRAERSFMEIVGLKSDVFVSPPFDD